MNILLKSLVTMALSIPLAFGVAGQPAIAQTIQAGILSSPALALEEDEATKIYKGTIDRLDGREMVIDDRLFHVAANSGIATASFSEQQRVEYQLNDQQEIILLRASTQRNDRPTPTMPRVPAKQPVKGTHQPVKQENGVWKN